MSIEKLLPILADGTFHSGEELGEQLGVSRTAVWKQLKKVEELLELKLDSVKGKGYRIEGGLELLSAKAIESHMTESARGLMNDLQIVPVLESTNAELMRQVSQQQISGLVCAAEKQTAGRGRRGRAWCSPYGRNLYFSLGWEFAGGAAALEGLSLAVGLAVVQVLQDMKLAQASLKWPNDVLCQGKKLAGVLLEMTGDAAGTCQVIVGIGLNVSMPSGLAKGIEKPWTDLEAAAGHKVSRNEVLGRLLAKLLHLLADFEEQGFAFYRQGWQKFDAYAGQSVKLILGNGEQYGIARGVDRHGALLLELKNGELQAFNGGEISLREVE